MTIKPLTPGELPAHQLKQLPESVIQCWNDIIAEKWDPSSKRSYVRQDDAVKYILNKHPDVTRAQVFDNHWLDIEDIYREQGWKVVYDKPHYSENYEANFTFSIK